MSHLAILYLARGDRRERLRSARYRVPALWLACFEPGDLTASGDADGVLLSTTPARALALLERRRPALASLVANLDEFLPAWSGFLRGLEEGRLVVDATEVLEMEGSTDDLAGPLRLALQSFEAPSKESLIALLDLCSLGEHRDPSTGVVSSPGPKRVVDAVPELAGTFSEDATFSVESASEALTGAPSPDPAGARERTSWPTERVYSALLAGAFALFVLTLARSGRPPSPFGWAALGWTAATALALWVRPRIGVWLFGGGAGLWAAVLAWGLATGTPRASAVELVAALAMVSGWFPLRRGLSRGR